MPLSQPRIRENPRDVKPSGFPAGASRHVQLKYALQYAVLAPSTYNSQPWLFRVTDASVYLYADRSRGLTAIDPEDRCMLMSCGAALRNFTLALDAFGFTYKVSRFPDLSDPDLLARVDVKERSRRDVDSAVLELLSARRTIAPLDAVLPPAPQVLALVQQEMERHGAAMSLLSDEGIQIVSQAVRDNREDAQLLAKEEAMWHHPNRVRSRDGLPGRARGTVPSFFDESKGAVFGVLVTRGDNVLSWLQGGMALESGLIKATQEHVGVSLACVPLHRQHVRQALGHILTSEGTPQVFLRMSGNNHAAGQPTPRRPIVDVMVHPGFSG